jgi:hypothetical protein
MPRKPVTRPEHPLRRASDETLRKRLLKQEAAETGTTKAPRVMTITCAKTGKEFQHVQVGPGRPPIYSPEVRAEMEANKTRATPRKQSALGRIVIGDSPTAVGQYTMRVTSGMKRDAILPWLAPVRVVEILEGKATVERTYDGERVPSVPLDSLHVVEVR